MGGRVGGGVARGSQRRRSLPPCWHPAPCTGRLSREAKYHPSPPPPPTLVMAAASPACATMPSTACAPDTCCASTRPASRALSCRLRRCTGPGGAQARVFGFGSERAGLPHGCPNNAQVAESWKTSCPHHKAHAGSHAYGTPRQAHLRPKLLHQPHVSLLQLPRLDDRGGAPRRVAGAPHPRLHAQHLATLGGRHLQRPLPPAEHAEGVAVRGKGRGGGWGRCTRKRDGEGG